VDLAISSDELWVGVKGLSNRVIAGSPRNAFRGSLWRSVAEVEHWMGNFLQLQEKTRPNSECRNSRAMERGSEL